MELHCGTTLFIDCLQVEPAPDRQMRSQIPRVYETLVSTGFPVGGFSGLNNTPLGDVSSACFSIGGIIGGMTSMTQDKPMTFFL